MSSSFIYSDNKNRANRVADLASNIGLIQQEVLDAVDRVDQKGTEISKTMDAILAYHNLQTVEQMIDKLQGLMSREEWEAYQKQVSELRGHNKTLDTMLDASLLVAFISGASGLVVGPIARIINTGALAATTELLSRGFTMMLRGEEKAAEVIGAALRTGIRLARGVELTAEAARFVRMFRAATTVLSVLGVVLDGIVLGIALIEGPKQREELQKAIKSLFCRRFQAKQLQDQILATEAHHGKVEAYLTTYSVLVQTPNMPEDSINQVLENLTVPIVDGVKNALAALTNEKVWEQCKSIDSMSRSWTDEDPSVKEVTEWLESQPAAEGTKNA